MTAMGHQPTILVVEDDMSMLDIITFLLEDEGYRVVQATGGYAALSILEEQRPDLIVSDVMMPGMDGFAFYKRVHAEEVWSHIPFIFLTAKGQRTDVRRGMGLGADDYLTKPFEPEELIAAVRVRLARAAERQEAISEAGSALSKRIVQTLTHEFRTPLALVVGYTELLESSGQEMGGEEQGMILDGLRSGSERLMQLVEDFLLLNRLESGSLAKEVRRESPETEEPDWIVSLEVERFEEKAARRRVRMTTQLETPGLTVAVGRQALLNILRKLLDNAIKFSNKEGGQVWVSTQQEQGDWVLEVADNGLGIRQEALPWIFDPFRQVDRDEMEQQGAGVGLAIVRGLVDTFGGRVQVKSVFGEGSVFTVRLPLAGDDARQGP